MIVLQIDNFPEQARLRLLLMILILILINLASMR